VRGLGLAAIAAAACGGAETPPPAPPNTAPLTAADLRPGANGGPAVIAPSRLDVLRIVGEKKILPDDKGFSRRASIKFCVDESGRVAAVTILQTSGDERYDAKIIASVQHWAYRPVVVDGQPTAVCSAMTFIYNYR
jgi:TonB family protein